MVPRKPRTRKRQMVPRVPATLAEAEEARIERAILVWRPFYEKKISAEASHEVFKAEFLRRLQAGAGTLDPAKIVELARNGHPSAAEALVDFIELAMDEDRYPGLPMCVRDYGDGLSVNRVARVSYLQARHVDHQLDQRHRSALAPYSAAVFKEGPPLGSGHCRQMLWSLGDAGAAHFSGARAPRPKVLRVPGFIPPRADSVAFCKCR
jgi:hypothetical protein